MKNRPELFIKLPFSILESILSNCELGYDSYEGSRAEEIEKFSNGYYDDLDWHSNYKIVQEYYKQLSDEELDMIIKNNIKGAEMQLEQLKELL